MLNQDSRLLRFESPLGKDKFIATYLSGVESISDVFQFDVELFSDDHNIQQSDIVGKPVTIGIYNSGEEKPRFVHGYVNQFALFDIDGNGLRCYRASIVPGMWFTTLASKNRVFHNKDVKKIIEEVLGEYSRVVRLQLKLSASYLPREYCVQYDETDFEFVTRLMAEEGISYYFRHQQAGHDLILADDVQDYYDCCSGAVEYDGGGSQPTNNSVNKWSRQFQYHTGGYEFTDYSEFTTTKDNKQTVKTKTPLNDVSGYKQHAYGEYRFQLDSKPHRHKLVSSNNQLQVKRIMEFDEYQFDRASGASDVAELSAGGRFQLEHYVTSEADKYLLVQVKITASDGNHRDTEFRNEFQCVPATVNPRPNPNQAKRVISHPQLATVEEVKATESSSSEDLYTQVKVKFPWGSEANSCWVRVVQAYAGKNWGANFVPRVGQEVVVEYVNGDPDRPIVTGAVFNGTNNGPNYTSTQSGWKSQLGGSEFNELRFDDLKGSEEIFMEAGKDHNFIVHNDQTGKVENDQTLEVTQNRSITVTDGNEKTTITKGDQSYIVSQGDQSTKIAKGTQTTDVKGAIKLTSQTSLELKVGASSIKMTPSGITIKSTKVDCNASGMGTVKAGGILTLKGSLTKVN